MGQVNNESRIAAYAGRWIATIHGRIVAHGGTPSQALHAAQLTRYKENPIVTYVPTRHPFHFSSIIDIVRESISDSAQGYLVGGAVRDALLSRPIHDYDFLISGDIFRTAKKIANKINGAYFPLDEKRGAARVVYTNENGDRSTLDFVALILPDLDSDLKSRDFTINAMAVALENPQQLLDPLGGAADLWRKNIRACSISAFEDDPVRILRAVRMAAGFGFRILPETKKLMVKSVGILGNVSTERKRDELFRILAGPKPHASVQALDMLGALGAVLPELLQLKNINQSPPHIKNAWEHTLDTLRYLESVLDFLSPKRGMEYASNMIQSLLQMHIGEFRRKIDEHLKMDLLPDRSLRSLIFMGALYHDIAKPESERTGDDGRIRFIKHETLGSEIVVRRGTQLHLSKKEINRLRLMVKNHMRPTHLAREHGEPSAKAIYRFFRSTGAAGIDVCLISLSDLLATYGNAIPSERWKRQLEIVRKLMDVWWSHPEEGIRPATLVTGLDLISAFNIKPGPLVGEILEQIREAQVTGEIKNREDAHHYIRVLLDKKEGADCV